MSKTLRDGRYVVESALGEGGQGTTYVALDTKRGVRVALKRFRVGKAKKWKDVELAEREAKTLASLDHHRLPRYVEHFEEDGSLVLVMELMEGTSLAALRKEGKVGSIADIERLLDDARSALDYLHERVPPVIHRDIKPANVIRKNDGSFAFVDFGSVRDRLKPAGGSTVVGTFGYMAPEQFQGRAFAATDVYGVGATVIAYLTGTEPEDLPHKGLAIDVRAAVPDSTPPWLVSALERMLDPDPDQRAKSISDALVYGSRRSARPPSGADEPKADRAERRRAARARRAEKRAERRARGHRRSSAPPPLALRLGGHVGLMIAQAALMVAIGIVVPLLLVVLSWVFGAALRRAATRVSAAHHRAQDAIKRGHDRLDRRAGPDAEPDDDVEDEDAREPRRRVDDDVLSRVRFLTPDEVKRERERRIERQGGDADKWVAEVTSRFADSWAHDEKVREWDERLDDIQQAEDEQIRDEAAEAARRKKLR